MSESVVSLAISLTGLGLSLFGIYEANAKASKADTKEYEHRFTEIETKMQRCPSCTFTEDDRKRLNDLFETIAEMKTDFGQVCGQMKALWMVFENEFPKFIKQEHTPELDRILKRIEYVGLRGLTISEYERLDVLINEEYEKSLLDESLQDRSFRLAIFRAVIRYAKDHGIISCS